MLIFMKETSKVSSLTRQEQGRTRQQFVEKSAKIKKKLLFQKKPFICFIVSI